MHLWRLKRTRLESYAIADELKYDYYTFFIAMSNGNTPTNEQLAQLIALLISDFIRPNAQQHLESMARLDRAEELLERHAEVIAGIDIKLDSVSSLMQEIATAQRAATERMETFDRRLEETRQLVAKNSSDVAQLGTKVDAFIEESHLSSANQQARIDQFIEESRLSGANQQARIDQSIEESRLSGANQQARIDQLIEENRAFRESQQSQLAAIIGNARRIDRLEQQAS